MAELTQEQILRQDNVDGACYGLICELAKVSDIPWDMEHISEVREAVQSVLVDKLHIMSEMEFYPYIEEQGPQVKQVERLYSQRHSSS